MRQIFCDIGEVQKRILLLPDIDKSGSNAGHHAPDNPQVEITNGALVLGIFNVEFSKLVVLYNGDTRSRIGYIDYNFFRHKAVQAVSHVRLRGSGGISRRMG